jgi:DNA-binding transcriptional LysR family regulator
MNFKQMEHLLALASTGSFSRAADQCCLTQPALSRSVQALEDELGGRLFDRLGKRLEPTPLGLEVLRRARRIMDEAAELRHSATVLQKNEGGALRLALGSGPGALLMIPVMEHMALFHPQVKLTVMRGTVESQLAQLRARDIDAVAVSHRGLPPAPDLDIELIGELRAGFVCRAGHPLTRLAQPGFDDLLQYPVASTPLSDEAGLLMVQHYGPRSNPSQLVTIECEDVASLIETIRLTDAVFLGIVKAAERGLKDGSLVELQLNPPFIANARFALVTLAGRTQPPTLQIFRRLISDRMQQDCPLPG